MKSVHIQTPKGERLIGPGNSVFIIAELSGNHNQDISRAKRLIDAAVEAGVDAVKLQTYTADTLTINCDKEWFRVKVNEAWSGKTLYELYKEAYTPWEWHDELKNYGEKSGLVVFSTPFDETAVDFLEDLHVVLYKVASFETGDLELLQKIGQKKKPVIMSRGLTTEEEIQTAIDTLTGSGCPQVIVLHCVSSYPATADQMNLSTIPDITRRFGVISGLSDHSLGITAAVSSIALGASVIEKHITLARAEGGPDAAFSLEPEELKHMVRSIREAEQAIGIPTYKAGEKESENLVFRRSIFVVQDIEPGDVLNRENIRVIRPGYGLPPKHLNEVLGTRAKIRIERGTPLTWDLLQVS